MTTGATACHRGFTMVELAIVILIVTLVSAGLLRPIGLYIEQRKIAETRETLETAKEALINFALLNKRLPCPDFNGDGLQDACPQMSAPTWPTPPQCPGATPTYCAGWIPFQDLRVAGIDAWDNRIGYQVSLSYTTATGIALNASSSINVATRVDDDPGPGVNKTDSSVAGSLPAMIISSGPNGFGATRADGNLTPNAVGGDELDNETTSDDHWHIRDRTPDAPGCSDSGPAVPYCEFDDILVWISPHVLKSRMVQAGQLP